jgi:hypothetical protein
MTNPKAKLVAEGLYDRDFCDVMTATEAETLWRLHQQQGQAFDAICDELASALGHDKSQLSDEQRDAIVEEAEDLIEEFDEADVAGRYQKNATPLMVCQRRFHDLGLEIMNVRDVIVARSGWA